MKNWIDITKELPPYTDLYIVYCKVKDRKGNYTDVRAYNYKKIDGINDYWQIPENPNEIVEITHWMELPDEPKEG